MPNPQKRKGADWERQATALLNKFIDKSVWRRIPGSGAIGTTISEPILTGDISGTVNSFVKKFKVEAKTGYGGAKQFVLKKEWLDKIRQEADNYYSIPLLFGKFSGAQTGVKVFVVMDLNTFADLINYVTELKENQNDET